MTSALFAEQVAAVPTDYVWRLSVEQYHDMIRTGILTEDDPVELLEGWLIPKMTKSLRHIAVTDLTGRALERVLPPGWYVRMQDPITTPDSEPEPDVAVVRGNTLTYLERLPDARDIALIVEVADSSLSRDRVTKKRLYARAGILIYWIVNLSENRVEVYSNPDDSSHSATYRHYQSYEQGETLPVVLDGHEIAQIAVREFLPII